MDDYDYLDDLDDDLDLDITLDSDDEFEGTSERVDTYTKKDVKLIGIENLNEEDQGYAFTTLSEGDHVYARYDFDNDKYEVMRHDHIIGWIPNSFIEDREQFFDKVGAIVVKKISNSIFRRKGIDVTIYLEDETGVESLPDYPMEDRKISVIDTDYWEGDWNEDWDINVFTDELCYKFPKEYEDNDTYTKIGSYVNLRYDFFVTDFLSGRIQTQNELEDCIDDLKYTIEDDALLAVGKKVLRKRIDSYLAHKGYTIHNYSPQAEENNDESKHSDFKRYEPHFQISYKNENGHHVTKTINHSNINISVVGMKHRENYQQLLNEIKEGTELTIKPDPSNDFDDTAIAFYTKDNMLVGYVSRKNKPMVELFMKKGELSASVSYADDGDVDTNIVLTKEDVDSSVIGKCNIMITKVNKVKGCGVYAELPETSSIEELIEALK